MYSYSFSTRPRGAMNPLIGTHSLPVGFFGAISLIVTASAVAQQNPHALYFKQAVVDTTAGTDISVAAVALAGRPGRFILQLDGPMTTDRRAALVQPIPKE